MREIDMQTWPRRNIFSLYCALDHPHFNMCANVDLTSFYPFIKQHGISFSIATVYVITRAANAIPEFRHRIRSSVVVEHETVHPSSTILTINDLFSFCTFDYVTDFTTFAAQAVERIAYMQAHPTVENIPGRDDMLYMTAIPWVSFTSFMHPLHVHPIDSIPRFAWGKYFKEGSCLKMPLSVQGHHAVMDGYHMGRYYAIVQELFQEPQAVLGSG